MIKSHVREDRKGMVLMLVLCFVMLMSISTVSLGSMLRQDVELIRRVKTGEQAKNLAEAGIHHAVSRIKNMGSSGVSAFSGSLDIGTYSVSFGNATSQGSQTKYLVTSTGTVDGVSKTVTAELGVNIPTALDFMCAAGNDARIAALLAICPITGDVHANNNVYLKGPLGGVGVTGDVSARGLVTEGTTHDESDLLDILVWINGDNNDAAEVSEGDSAPIVTFPVFDYEAYRAAAMDDGIYYGTDDLDGNGVKEFEDETLSPNNGIVFVDGDVRFVGDCTVNGGIIADNIYIGKRVKILFFYVTSPGEVEQYSTEDNRNVFIARNGDIQIRGKLDTEEALVYASRDIVSLDAFDIIDVNGALVAGRDIYMWSVIAYISYNYVSVSPMNMENQVYIASWNT
ncbi:MAG: hypothetical protein PHQ61_03510 [Candidatus Omnitrophica bacterium]|nr:hypothetical protein [Candidatus Omnitrophota bacterium]